MTATTDDLRIQKTNELISPEQLIADVAVSDTAAETVANARRTIHNILAGEDDRLLVIVGPCSIHDPDAAREYAAKLRQAADAVADDIFVVMRVYFEKPRTTVGWKGLINDPDLNNTFQINKGLHLARQLLLDLADMGLPAGTEYLDLISPQYYADLISWGAIGARTTESQTHRELSSGLSCPVGFKNATDGDIHLRSNSLEALLSRKRAGDARRDDVVAGVVAVCPCDDRYVLVVSRAVDIREEMGECEHLAS